jgi:hypothetical protein
MAITATKFSGDISFAPDSRRSPFFSEFVRIQGATGAAGDTATYTPEAGKPVAIVGGAFRISAITGSQATIQAKVALGNDDAVVEMLCKY